MFVTEKADLQTGHSTIDPWDNDPDFEELVYRITNEAQDEPWPEEAALPDGLETMAPGIFLAASLHAIERNRVSGHDLVRVLQARERLVAHYQAGVAEDMVEIAHLDPPEGMRFSEDLWEFASDEIRAALHLTRYGATARLDMALQLVERLPRVLSLLARGSIDFHRARVIVTGTGHLEADTARGLVDSIAHRAPDLTSGELAALIRKLAVDTDPEEAKKRYEAALGDRRVWIEQTVDGTANLHAYDLPVDRARAIGRRLNGYAISLKNGGDTRTHDQLRTDVLVDLLDGAVAKGQRMKGVIDMRVDLTTLADLDERSADIPGMGPVIADIARQVAAVHPDAEWRYTVTDEFGNPMVTGITRRRPNTAHIRRLQSLHATCVFPGCRMPAADCDIDHNVPWAEGGPTTIENTTPKCRHDHDLRHRGGWRYRFENGRHIWTSPLGHVYITRSRSP